MSDGNLYSAHNQWANRPADQRFWTVDEMAQRCASVAERSREAKTPWRDIRAEVVNGALALTGRSGREAQFTHHSFGQVARLANTPADYMRTLPPTLVAQNLNHGLAKAAKLKAADDEFGNGLFHIADSGALTLRALTSESYGRLWDHEMISRYLKPLVAAGWVAPPAYVPWGMEGDAAFAKVRRTATEADVGPHTKVRVGDLIAPAGLYASDHDFFAFLVDKANPIDLGDKPGFRFLLFSGDELGKASVWLCMGVEDYTCGNHIIWGAKDVIDVRIRHIKSEGSTDKLFSRVAEKLEVLMSKREDGNMEKVAAMARTQVLGSTKEDVLDAVFKYAKTHGLGLMTKKRLDAAYDATDNDTRWGSPRTTWGLVSGLTYNSQKEFAGAADMRTAVDYEAGKLLNMVF